MIHEDSFDLRNFLFTTQGQVLYILDGVIYTNSGVIINPKIKKTFTRNEAAIRSQFIARWVGEGDLVCAKSNIQTEEEQWWVAAHISPVTQTVYSRDLKFSAQLQEIVPLRFIKSIVLHHVFKDDAFVYEKWWMEATSFNLEERKRAVAFALSTLMKNKKLSYGGCNFTFEELNTTSFSR